MLTLNKLILLGTVPEGFQLTFGENGTPQCNFTLLVEEKGTEHTHRLYIPVNVFGVVLHR
jgi:hypothetical protein